MNKQANLTKRVKTPQGLRFCPVVISGNGRVKPDYVIIAGEEERHPEGAYYVEWYEGSKRIRQSVGKDASTAAARRQRQEQILASKAIGLKLADEGKPDGLRLADAVATYLEEVRIAKKAKTHAAYKTALEYFLEACNKPRVADIDRSDLLHFSAFLRDTKKLQPRTVYNKFENLMSFLKAQGIRGLVSKNDWPRYVEDEPEIYDREELDKFFAACDEDERLYFEFFLMTGLREQEVIPERTSDVIIGSAAVEVYVTGVFIKPLSQDLHLGRGVISTAMGLANITTAIMAVVSGRWMDKYGLAVALVIQATTGPYRYPVVKPISQQREILTRETGSSA